MAIALTTPSYRVFQRDYLTGKGTIEVAGTGATPGATVEARWNGGDWTTMTVSGTGAFTGSIVNQNSGQGDLEVRQNGGAVAATSNYVGIGSIFVGTGASNISGRGTNNQSYTHPTLKAGCFKNNYAWAELVDPTDSHVSQTDTVSKDFTPTAAGSWIPHFATHFMAEYGYPAAYVPCPKGSSAIETWVDIGTDRSTLFGSMAYRLQQVGGAELVFFMTNGTNAASYEANFTVFANALSTYGCDHVMQISGARASGYTPAFRHLIWKSQQDRLAKQNPNIVPGPQFRSMTSDDTLHFLVDEKLAKAGRLVFEYVKKWKDIREGISSFRQPIT